VPLFWLNYRDPDGRSAGVVVLESSALKVAAQAAAGSIKTWRVRIRPPSIRATSVPVTAAGPFGGPDCQRSRPRPWWPTAGPIAVKTKFGGRLDKSVFTGGQGQVDRHRRASRSLQDQERDADLAVLVGDVHLEIDRGADNRGTSQ
jgi:hypothetical protein